MSFTTKNSNNEEHYNNNWLFRNKNSLKETFLTFKSLGTPPDLRVSKFHDVFKKTRDQLNATSSFSKYVHTFGHHMLY